MNIVIINKSDCVGGAAVVSHRLLHALRNNGVNATMLVMEASGAKDSNVVEYGHSLIGKYHFLMERLGIYTRNGFSRPNLFKVSTALSGFDLSKHSAVKNADAILLNWVNQGAMSLKGLENICKLGKPVFWTMHDLWECTGICHLPNGCERFKESCGMCKYLQSDKPNDLSHKVLLRKAKIYENPNLRFVCVSRWVADRCHESTLLKGKDITVIPNAFPINSFDYTRLPNLDGIPADKLVMTIGAARLDDTVKGLPVLIEAMNEIVINRPNLASKLHLVLYGTIRDNSLLDKIRLPHTFVGKLNGTEKVAELFQRSDIVLSSSHYEMLSGTLIEGAAAGCIPVTFGVGGQIDIVEHRHTGYVADYLSPKSFADGIEWAAKKLISRQALHENIKNKFSAESVADKYISHINKYLKQK